MSGAVRLGQERRPNDCGRSGRSETRLAKPSSRRMPGVIEPAPHYADHEAAASFARSKLSPTMLTTVSWRGSATRIATPPVRSPSRHM